MTNVTLSGNTATLEGGGYHHSVDADMTELTNVTLSENSAPTGGALYSNFPRIQIKNTIVANSRTGGNCLGALFSSQYSISSDATCQLAGTGDHNRLDPRLSALGNFGGFSAVHMLLSDSPAIDGVDGTDAPKIDQRGLPRPAKNGFDIGAVERQSTDFNYPYLLRLPLLLK